MISILNGSFVSDETIKIDAVKGEILSYYMNRCMGSDIFYEREYTKLIHKSQM